MPTRRQALAGLLLGAAALVPAARAQHRLQPWPEADRRPDLEVSDLEGRVWTWEALRGRAVLVNFWATWCPPCKEEMPSLQTLAELEADRLLVLAVNVREPLPRVRRYLHASGLDLPVLPDPQGALAQAWGVTVFPTTVLIDIHGQPRQRVTGAVDWTGSEAGGWIQQLGR